MDESAPLVPTIDESLEQGDAHESKQSKPSGKFRLRFGYACGHAQNDLCAAMYFSYLLVYLEGAGLRPVSAGVVLIAGQLVDGMSTPIVGYLSDQVTLFNESCCFGFSGKRKSWYMFGLAMVSAGFWPLFTPYPSSLLIPPVVYYALANCIMQVGWATVQVSHMSLVPELTPLHPERCFLNSIRFAVTVGSSIAVYVLVWLMPSDNSINGEITEGGDTQQKAKMLMVKLQIICYIVLLIGALLGLVFIFLVKEGTPKEEFHQRPGDSRRRGRPSRKDSIIRASKMVRASVKRLSMLECTRLDISDLEQEVDLNAPPKSFTAWLKTPGFFGVLSNYFLTRLCVNTLQLYLPYFVLYAIPTHAAVATVPLTAYVGMCISSILAPRVSALINDAAYLYISASLCLLMGSSIVFLAPAVSYFWVSLAAFVLGLSCAQLMVTTQTQVCELVGSNSNGGIVFGMNSFCDKVSTGVVIYGIQRLAETVDDANLAGMYEKAATIVPLICAILGALALMTVPKSIRDRTNGCNS